MNTGWICPKCAAGVSPSEKTCPCAAQADSPLVDLPDRPLPHDQEQSIGDIKNVETKKSRDIFYYRKRLKNRIFSRLSSFFAKEAERTGITKMDIARRLDRDPSQVTLWLAGPSNLTLDILSDLLFAMDAEADPPHFVRFADRAKPNHAHPLIRSITGSEGEPAGHRDGSTFSAMTGI